MRLILASASPRRAALLRDAGYAFAVESADVDEERHAGAMPPRDLAAFLARAKADAVSQKFPGDLTLGADTVVELNGASLGKPTDATAAREMIRTLAGTTHQVITGVSLRRAVLPLALDAIETSTVQMRPLSDAEIDQYVASNLWRGRAGGYGIQDPNPIVTCARGSITNVIGLPMETTIRLLEQAGVTRGEV